MASQVVEMTADEARLLRSLQKVIAKEEEHKKKLRETGDEGQRTGDKLGGAFDKAAGKAGDSARKSQGYFQTFSTKALASVLAIGGGFATVGTAVRAVNTILQEQDQLLENALNRVNELAASQQEASKNLAGIAAVQRDTLLQEAVPQIARQTGFPDISEITNALGAVASAGESDAQDIVNAVKQSARVSRLTPEQLAITASNASAVQRQTGLADIRQSIALVQTTGTQARITDPSKLLESLPRAVGSAVSTVPQQDPEEAARQAAALFAQITQAGNDEVGRKSATFTTTLVTKLDSFFTQLDKEQVKARSQIELIDRKIGKGSDTELDRLNKANAEAFLAAAEGVADPGELFGRIQLLQQRQALGARFVGEGFGEQQFRPALTALLNGQSDLSKAIRESFGIIQANAPFFEEEARQQAAGTPQLAIAAAGARFEAGLAAFEGFNIEAAALKRTREIFEQTTTAARGRSFGDFVERFGVGALPTPLQLEGGTAIEETVSAVQQLSGFLGRLREGGITQEEAPRVQIIESGIESLLQLARDTDARRLNTESLQEQADRAERIRRQAEVRLESGTGSAGFNQAQLDAFTRLADILEDQLTATQEVARNTQPDQPNFGAIQNQSR